MEPAPLILTLAFDAATFATLNELRQAHFPPARNYLPAHLTLFHALPAAEETTIRNDLAALAETTSPLPLRVAGPHFMGRGVLLIVEAPELRELRARLAEPWKPWLTPQDRQGFRPHVTIQNKAAPDTARQLFADLSASWRPLQATGEELLLWRYLGRPWELVATFPFRMTQRKPGE